jgi:hypothetical protein
MTISPASTSSAPARMRARRRSRCAAECRFRSGMGMCLLLRMKSSRGLAADRTARRRPGCRHRLDGTGEGSYSPLSHFSLVPLTIVLWA